MMGIGELGGLINIGVLRTKIGGDITRYLTVEVLGLGLGLGAHGELACLSMVVGWMGCGEG